jgi:hypothetical protein
MSPNDTGDKKGPLFFLTNLDQMPKNIFPGNVQNKCKIFTELENVYPK